LKVSVLASQISAFSGNKETVSTEVTASIQRPVIRIQAFWRKCVAEWNYGKLRELGGKSQYFCDEEIFETLSGQELSWSEESLSSSSLSSCSYMYTTGTCYKGQWLGGFRHGTGDCTWPDGSKYSGSWSFGYPFNQGTFIYKDGETFTGLWLHPYATLKNRSFLEDIIQGKRDGYGKP